MVKILLVEDNELNRDMITRRLQKRGFDVITAENGKEGIDMAVKTLPQLILMDMNLPVIDGWEATRQLKSNPATKSIPILGISAHAMEEEQQKALDAGCDDYDTKPLDLERLLKKIKALIEN